MIAIPAVAYGIVAVVVWRMLAGHFAYWYRDHARYGRDKVPDEPDGEQWVGGMATALIPALLWPLVIVLVLVPYKPIGAEAKGLAKAQQRRIAELEKQLKEDQ